MMPRGLPVVLGALAGYLLFNSFAVMGFTAAFVSLLAPVPAAYVGMRNGTAAGGYTVVLTVLLVMLAGGVSAALMYLLQFGLPAVGLPWLLNRGVAWDKSTVAVLWAMLVVSICALFVAALAVGQSPFSLADELVGKEITRTTAMMQEIFTDANLPAERRAEVTQALENMAVFLDMAYPGIVIVVGGLITLGVVFVLSLLARGRYVVPGTNFSAWKAPEPLVWALIVSGFLVLLVDGVIGTFALNLLVVLLPVYFLQGLAVVDYFFRLRSFSPIFRVIGFVLVTLVNPLPILVTGVGVFDLWADFRKPRTPES